MVTALPTLRFVSGALRGLLLLAFFQVSVAAQEAPASSPEAVRPPLILAVAVDEMGIGEGDLQRSRELVLAIQAALPPRSQIVVASFSGDKRILATPTEDRAQLSAALEGFKAGANGVALPDGLFDIVDYLGGRDADLRSVLLISAGRVREGDLQFEDPLNAASTRRIPIFALAVGQGDGKLLRRIAKITGGDYLRLEVADAGLLARALRGGGPVDGASPDGGSTARGDASPTPTPSRGSAGLLGAAAVFFSLGGLLMLGLVFLLIRRLAAPAADKPAPAPPPPAPAHSPVPPLPSLALSGSMPQPQLAEEEEPVLEKTLVVNANPTLRALSGPGAGKNFPLSPAGQTSVGRSRRNDIVVPEDAASAQHCRIDREGDSYVLHDLGSTNGTWLNGARTERAVLQHGDRLKVGGTVFTVSLFGDRD